MSPAPAAHDAALHCCVSGLSYADVVRPYSATESEAAVSVSDELTLNDQLKVTPGPPPPPPPPPSPKKDELLLVAPYHRKLAGAPAPHEPPPVCSSSVPTKTSVASKDTVVAYSSPWRAESNGASSRTYEAGPSACLLALDAFVELNDQLELYCSDRASAGTSTAVLTQPGGAPSTHQVGGSKGDTGGAGGESESGGKADTSGSGAETAWPSGSTHPSPSAGPQH